jgi:hypothetical protein
MIYGLVAPGYQMAEVAARNILAADTSSAEADADAPAFTGADMSTKLKLSEYHTTAYYLRCSSVLLLAIVEMRPLVQLWHVSMRAQCGSTQITHTATHRTDTSTHSVSRAHTPVLSAALLHSGRGCG